MKTAALALVLAAATAGAQAPTKIQIKKLQPLSVGLAGYGGAEAARSDSFELQKYLSSRLNREITTRVFPDGDALAAAISIGQVDVGWMQPFTLIAAQKRGKVEPVVKAVRHGLPFYRGVFFTKADRKVEGGVKGLKGLKVAWVSKTSAAGYLFPRAGVVRSGAPAAGFFKSEDFLGDHPAVCRAVLDGKADVGATFADDRSGGEAMKVDGCVQSVGEEEAKGLKIVSTSEPIPNDAIAVRPGLDAEDVARLKKAFLGMKDDADGKILLAATFKAEGFDDVGSEDFEPVRFAAEAAAK